MEIFRPVIFSRFYWNWKCTPRINFNFFLGAKTQKTQLEIIHISQSHSPRHGDVLLISRLSWNSKWPSWINFIYFVGARTKILKSEIIQILHPPRYGDVQVIFRGLTEIQNGCYWSTWQFFCVRKNLKVRNYTNFTITFPTIWRCGKKKFPISYFEHACPKWEIPEFRVCILLNWQIRNTKIKKTFPVQVYGHVYIIKLPIFWWF